MYIIIASYPYRSIIQKKIASHYSEEAREKRLYDPHNSKENSKPNTSNTFSTMCGGASIIQKKIARHQHRQEYYCQTG